MAPVALAHRSNDATVAQRWKESLGRRWPDAQERHFALQGNDRRSAKRRTKSPPTERSNPADARMCSRRILGPVVNVPSHGNVNGGISLSGAERCIMKQ
jgi:hypothetical protein